MRKLPNNRIRFNHPPFVDGTYDQIISLIRHVFAQGRIANKDYEAVFINDVFDLKDREENPIKYIKRWAKGRATNCRGLVLFTLPFLNTLPDNTQLSETEMQELLDKIESVFHSQNYEYEKCPFPLSKEDILKRKKSIINRLYFEDAKSTEPLLNNDITSINRKNV